MPEPRRKTGKRRLSPQKSRALALAAARDLLIEGGPQAITLKAVAGRIGQTHSNLLHHFGSAAALHRDLTLYLAHSLYEDLQEALHKRQAGTGSVRGSVDAVFETFAGGGGGKLCAWLALNGNTDFFSQFAQVFAAIPDAGAPGGKSGPERRTFAFQISMLAFSDALLGAPLAGALGLPKDIARQLAEQAFSDLLKKEGSSADGDPASGALDG